MTLHKNRLILISVAMAVPTLLVIWPAATLPAEKLETARQMLEIWGIALIYLAYRRLKDKPALFILSVGIVCLGVNWGHYYNRNSELLFQERSIFGVNKVVYQPKHHYRQFIHGTTLHGIQPLDEAKRLSPKSYYSGLEEVFALPRADLPIAVMGLGAGTLACFGAQTQSMDFYEIDPLVEAIAANPAFFTYMKDCPPQKRVILGDGRQRIAQQPNGTYGIIVMDAFASDAIPTHLITREAVQLYMQKLAEGGVIAFHISNRHINLEPVLAAITKDLGLSARIRRNGLVADDPLIAPSQWVVIAGNGDILAPLTPQNKWTELKPAGSARFLWTDDFSNVFFTLRFVQKLLREGGV